MSTAIEYLPPYPKRMFGIVGSWHSSLRYRLAVGLVLPSLCLYFDPIIFNSGLGEPYFPAFKITAYLSIGIAMVSFWIETYLPPDSKVLTSILGGILAAAGVWAILLGVLMLPISFLGLMMIIGIFGFSPFLIGALYWGAGRAAVRRAFESGYGYAYRMAVLGALSFLALSVGCQWTIVTATGQLMVRVKHGDVMEAGQVVADLGWRRSVIEPRTMVLAWGEASEGDKDKIATAYKALTGRSVAEDYYRLLD